MCVHTKARPLLWLLLLTGIPVQEAFAVSPADSSARIPQVTVAADKAAGTLSSAPLQRLDRPMIDSLGRTSLTSVIHDFAGVSIKDYGGVGGIKTVDVRNMGAAHTVVEYDGIAMGDFQNASVDIGRFDLGELASVSLEMAGSDDIFRSARHQLAAGVLSVESAVPHFDDRPFHLSAQLSGGSFYYGNARLGYEQRWGKNWSTRLGGAFLYAKGDYPYLVNNGIASTVERRLGSESLDGRGNFDLYGNLGENAGRLRLKLLYSQAGRGIPGPVIFYSQDPTEHLWNKDLTAMLRWENEYGSGLRVRANLSYGWSFTRYRNGAAYLREPEIDNYHHHQLSAGGIVAWRFHPAWQLSLAEDLVLAKLDSDIPECRFPRRLHSATALSAKFERGRWLVRGTAGLIYVTESLRQPDASAPTGDSSASQGLAGSSRRAAPDKLYFSPSLSASCALWGGLRLRLSYKDSYRMPSFNDLYYARVGNASLRPEKATQFNLGLTWRCRPSTASTGPASSVSSQADSAIPPVGFSADVTADAYANIIRDKIVAIPKMFIWSMRNVGKAVAAGADLSARFSYAFSPRIALALQGKYSFQYAVDVTDPASQTWRKQLPYTPRHTGGGTLSLLTRWVNVSYTLDGVSERYTIGVPLPEYRLDAYLLHSLSLNHTIALKGWKLYLAFRADNLGDARYEIIRSYPMPGFHWTATLRIIL